MEFQFNPPYSDRFFNDTDQRFSFGSYNFPSTATGSGSITITTPKQFEQMTDDAWKALTGVRIEFSRGLNHYHLSHQDVLTTLLEKTRLQFLQIVDSTQITSLPEVILEHPLEILQVSVHAENLDLGRFLQKMTKLTALKLSSKKNLNIGASLHTLSNLKYLSVSAQYFSSVDALVHPVHLKSLSIKDSLSSYLPNNINQLKDLEVLYIANMRYLTDFPDISHLKKLKQLDVYGASKVCQLPPGLSTLQSLEILRLNSYGRSASKFSGKEMWQLQNLTNLWSLSLESSPIYALPRNMQQWTKMRKLRFNSLPAIYLSRSIGKLNQLEDLRIESCNVLLNFPKSINELSKLQEIHITTRRKSLPLDVSKMTHLKEFVLRSSPHLKRITSSLAYHPSLKRIAMYGMSKLETLPPFGKFNENLNYLDISDLPTLKYLPDSLGECPNLQRLSLSLLNVESLPKSLTDSETLENLKLYRCSNFQSFYAELANCSSLKYLSITTMENKTLAMDAWVERLKLNNVLPEIKEALFFLLLKSYERERFSNKLKTNLLKALQVNDQIISTYVLDSLYVLNHNGKRLQDIEIDGSTPVFILGQITEEESVVHERLKKLGFHLVSELDDKVRFILVGNQPEFDGRLWEKERFFFSEVELGKVFHQKYPGFLQQKDLPPDYLNKVRELLWSTDPHSELVALEIIKTGGTSPELRQDLIAVARTTPSTEVRTAYFNFLQGKLTYHEQQLLTVYPRHGSQDFQPNFLRTLSQDLPLSQFLVSYYKRTGKLWNIFFIVDDGSSLYRRDLMLGLIEELVKIPQQIYIREYKLNEMEWDEIFNHPAFKGQLKSVKIESGYFIKAFPEALLEHTDTLKVLELHNTDFLIDAFPMQLFALKRLENLYFSNAKFYNIPGEIVKLQNLQTVDFTSQTHPVSYPEEIEQLPNLKKYKDGYTAWKQFEQLWFKSTKKNRF